MASYFYQEPHFLEACSLCQRSLGFNSDIFMYRGNTPFCSKDCREEQIEMDHAKAKKSSKVSSSSRSIRKASESNESSSSKASESVRSTTLVVA